MLFAFVCKDKPNSSELRKMNRSKHLAWLQATPGLYIAGPLLAEDGSPTGSLLVVDHEDLEVARAWAKQDPYAKAGLFASVDIAAWTKAIGA